MTVFLTVVDRKTSRTTPTTEDITRVRDVLEATAGRYIGYLGNDYEAVRNISSPRERPEIHVLHWNRCLKEESIKSEDNYWAMTAGHGVSEKLVKHVRPRGGSLQYAKPVWGHYAAIFGTHSRPQMFAWNTVPALEAIHWASTEDYIFVSNRPLLVAQCLSVLDRRGTPELSLDYLGEYLLYGYSISGRTPFKNVYTLSVNSALVITNGDIKIAHIPEGMCSELQPGHTLDEGVDALVSALSNAMDRTEKEIAGRSVQLRMSGGKDSRLLLALLRNRDIDFRSVTFGNETSADVMLASHLHELAGAENEMRSPRPADGETIVERIAVTVRQSGGIPASEPHTAQYRGADPEKPHEAIMLGQWPLYKGGMATRLGLSTSEVNHVLKWQGGNVLRRNVRVAYDEYLREWSDKLVLADNLEKLYLFAREFRSGRYLHAHINQYSGSSMIAYPLADAEVGAVCDALSMYEKVSEKALFGALESLWPEAVKIPLDRAKWRFEADGPDSDFSGPWYSQRYSAIPTSKPSKITPVERGKSEYSDEAVLEMSEYVVNSANFDLLAQFISDGLLGSLRSGANGVISKPKGMPDRTFKKFIWRICVADVWLSKSWMAGSQPLGM